MWRIGPAGYPPGSKGGANAVEKARALGLDALEVQFGRGITLSDERSAEIGAKAKELDVALSAHAPYYINFNCQGETKAKSEDWLLRSLRAATIFSGNIVVVHAASYAGGPPEKATAAVVESLLRVRDVMVEERLTPLIGLETMGKTGTWGTLREIGEVMREVDGVVPVVDFAHIHARNGGSLRGRKDFEALLDEAEAVHGGHLHCHYSGIEYTAKGEKKHIPIDENEPDYGPLADIIVSRSLDVTLICEAPDPSGDAVRMKGMLVQRT